MGAAGFAWVLNLDADVELAAIASGAAGARTAYAPTRAVREAMRAFVPGLAKALLDPGQDVLVDDDSPPGTARGKVGRAFCPTPRALRLLRRAGAEPEAHPACDVLVRVNSRAFASSLGTTLPGAAFVADEARARTHLAAPPPSDLSDAWRIKRNFGMAGRGQRVVVPPGLTEADVAFVRAGLAEGGVQIEPDVAIVDELALHGMLAQGGALTLGPVVRQRCDARGAWLSTERMPPAQAPAELEPEAERVASALTAAGYFGPFGIDAFTYRPRHGASLALQPRSEINARFTMGFAVTWDQLRSPAGRSG
jgi:hypothetical protein